MVRNDEYEELDTHENKMMKEIKKLSALKVKILNH